MTRTVEDRFWIKVEKTAGCWWWRGGKTAGGYGVFWDGRRFVGAHVFAFLLSGGVLKPGQEVCHECDNRQCVRFDCLFSGTRADNMRDAAVKGRIARGDRHWSRRHPERRSRGERHGRSKLSLAQVEQIRVLRGQGEALAAVAAKFGVSFQTVSKIARGTRWATSVIA